jgi:tetratricopeptide (TPR) repeat protein
MPNSARVLRFPSQACRISLKPAEALGIAEEYLRTSAEDRSDALRERVLSNPDVLMAVLGELGRLRDSGPKAVLEETETIYVWLRAASAIGVFDERDYFLGEAAHLAGVASRHLGHREDANRWLDRAESHFRHTLNPGPSLANVGYVRLSLAFESGRYDDLLELIPSIRRTFERLRMSEESAKCLLLEGMTLKKVGRTADALGLLLPIRDWEAASVTSALKGRIVSEIGDLCQLENRVDDAMSAYQEALGILGNTTVSQARADLKMFVGEAYRTRGSFEVALEAFRSAVADYLALGLTSRTAYLRIYVADTLLQLNRNREAEWEILAALPTIEEQKMVPEGFAAVALLKESVRRRKTDPNALRELREHLQASK